MYYYHGSTNHLEVGTILKGRGEAYERDYKSSIFYSILEHFRPSTAIAHKDAVFMCSNDEDIDYCGGGTDYLFTLEALDKVERHDMQWGSEISCLYDQILEFFLSSDIQETFDNSLDYQNFQDILLAKSSKKEYHPILVKKFEAIKDCAKNYWDGVESEEDSLWEYLTKSAKIIKVEDF